jgi:hypothetical protein
MKKGSVRHFSIHGRDEKWSPRCRWCDDIQIYIDEIRCESMD